MVKIARGVCNAGANVLGLEIGKVLEDFILRRAGGKHIENVLHTDAHPADTGASAALIRIDGDAFQIVHFDSSVPLLN